MNLSALMQLNGRRVTMAAQASTARQGTKPTVGERQPIVASYVVRRGDFWTSALRAREDASCALSDLLL